MGYFGIGYFGIGYFGIGYFGIGYYGIGYFGIGYYGIGYFGIGYYVTLGILALGTMSDNFTEIYCFVELTFQTNISKAGQKSQHNSCNFIKVSQNIMQNQCTDILKSTC